MKKSQYKIDIKAPKNSVFDKMIDPKIYKKWTYAFNPTSHFEGSWEKGEKIKFIGFDDKGKKQGMLAEIAENIPGEFISIHHYGLVNGDDEITSGPEVEKWGPAFENYHFEENDGITTVTVEIDVVPEYADYFDKTWPEALKILKTISET